MKIVANVENTIFRNTENGYTVLSLAYNNKTLTAVGTIPEVFEGQTLELHGEFIVNKKFGEQFKIDTFEKLMPENAAALEKYLASGTINWSNKGYGLVKSLTITHINSTNKLGTVSIINDVTTSFPLNNKLWVGEINSFKIDISYKDGTSKSMTISYDNTIDWGSINSAKAINIKARTFTLLLNYNLNKEYDYIKRIVVLENNVVKKNFFISSEHYNYNEIEIELSNKLMEPETTHTYELRALNMYGTIVWYDTITVTSLRELTDEEEFQYNMANIAFKTLIDNLLKALNLNNNN